MDSAATLGIPDSRRKTQVSTDCARFCQKIAATDALPMLQEKMQEYLNAGLRLAGLINPQQQQVEIDRFQHTPAARHLPTELSGEDVLPEFSLNLDRY
jgi:Uma2 family endonuclease